MSIQNNFPALKPTLSLDFANTKELDPRITFTRASTATYYGTQTAVAEQNLVTSSQDFTNVGWSKVRVTVTGDTTLAPDGTTTADTITNTATTGAHEVDISAGAVIVSGLTYTISFFAKKNTNDFFQISTFNASNTLGTGRANFNLATGVTGSVDGGTSTITDAGNGWYRCTYTVTASASGSVNIYAVIVTSSTAARFESYTGLGTESVYLWGAQLEQRSAVTAYTPTTTQPIINYIPVLETAASGVARFDHNPTTFESLGLLIEESRTNLLTYSEQFDNAAWTKVNSSITANAIVAPDGTLTGDKLVDTTASANHVVRPATASVTSGTTYTYSIFVKAGERTQFQIGFGTENSAFAAAIVQFTLTGSGAATAISGSPTFSIAPVGNGWYRCTATATATATASAFIRNYLVSGTNAYTGDGYSGLYIWGAQLEAGAFATSYIPTVASQVTRAADSPTITGTNFSSWYNNAQGTLYSEASTYDVSSSGRTGFAINDATNNNRIQVAHGTVKVFIGKGGSVQFTNSFSSVTVTNNVSSKVALAYANNNANGSVNGVIGGVDDTVVEVPVVTQVNIGSLPASNILNGTIRKIAYYPIRVTNAQLQALTS